MAGITTEPARNVARLWLAFVGVAYVGSLLWDLAGWKLWRYGWDQIWWVALWMFYFIPWTIGWLSFPGMWILGQIRNRGSGRLLWRWWAGCLLTSVAFGTGNLLYAILLTLTWPEPSVLVAELLVPLASFPAIWVLTTKPRNA